MQQNIVVYGQLFSLGTSLPEYKHESYKKLARSSKLKCVAIWENDGPMLPWYKIWQTLCHSTNLGNGSCHVANAVYMNVRDGILVWKVHIG